MPGLYGQLVNIIGKTEDDPAFKQLTHQLGAMDVLKLGRRNKSLEFKESGLSIQSEAGIITMAFFHFDSVSVQSGSCKPYQADLLNGIAPGEVRSVVLRKMEREPDRSARIRTNDPTEPKDFWEHYDFPDVELTFIFSGATECLGGMSIHGRRHNVDSPPPFDEAAQNALFADFSPDLLEVIRFAENESRSDGHDFIGSEQLLLGLLVASKNGAAVALNCHGVYIDDARSEVRRIIGLSEGSTSESLSFTPMAQNVLFGARRQANLSKQVMVEPHHLLLAIIEEGTGVAYRVLENLNCDIDALQRSISGE